MSSIIILSDKSSGSSILQKELTKHPKIHTATYTRHYENETLFWVKAAAILGMPQEKIHYSEVPFDNEFAKIDFLNFLEKNIPDYEFEKLNKKTIFSAWTALCKRFGPIFIEKSPHHLHVSSSLELISEYIDSKIQDVKIIGMIRNPMDTLYSSWKRWGAYPELSQYDWYNAYKNLNYFQNKHPDRCIILRYEDFVSDKHLMIKICDFLDIKKTNEMGNDLHAKSRGKWKKDIFFGFQLAHEIHDFAKQYGYDDINIHSKILWSINKIAYPKKIKIKNFLKSKINLIFNHS